MIVSLSESAPTKLGPQTNPTPTKIMTSNWRNNPLSFAGVVEALREGKGLSHHEIYNFILLSIFWCLFQSNEWAGNFQRWDAREKVAFLRLSRESPLQTLAQHFNLNFVLFNMDDDRHLPQYGTNLFRYYTLPYICFYHFFWIMRRSDLWIELLMRLDLKTIELNRLIL